MAIRLAAFQPDIAQNLGSMIRTCACLGVGLDVIEPCGFPFSVKALRRAAMDYADIAEIFRHDDWGAFVANKQAARGGSRLVLLSTHGTMPYWDFEFASQDVLLVGRESAGVPEHIVEQVDDIVTIPMPGGGRSLNVAVAAGMVLSEALRQTRSAHAE